MPLARLTRTSIVVALLSWATPGIAQTTDQCVTAFHQGQERRDALALREARERFALCSRAACPVPLRTDCADELAALLRDLPSIVPGARKADGTDIGAISTFVDGAPVVIEAGGSVSLDPGKHVIRIESAGYLPASSEILLRIGERNRPVLLTLTEGSTTPEQGEPPSPSSRRSPLFWPLVGVGAVGLGAFGYFGINGLVDRNDARDRCGPTCGADDESRVRTQFIIADVSLAVGVLALAGAAFVYVTDRSHAR
jgi:hypothetical protein